MTARWRHPPGFNKLIVANIQRGPDHRPDPDHRHGAVAAVPGALADRVGESILNRMPVVRTIYGASKQILETVISAQSDAFRDAVLVEYPRRGLWVIGFVTGGTKGEVAERMDGNMVNVFIPTTPNPTSGFLLFCPRNEVIYLDMSVEDAVKLVVSGGIVHPPEPAAGKSAKKAARKSPGTSSAKSAVKARGKKSARAGGAKTSSGRKSPAKSAAKRS